MSGRRNTPVPGDQALQDQVRASAEALADLSARAKGRRVGAIMQSTASGDQALQELILDVAQGLRRDWTHVDVLALQNELEADERRLDRWLLANRYRAQEARS